MPPSAFRCESFLSPVCSARRFPRILRMDRTNFLLPGIVRLPGQIQLGVHSHASVGNIRGPHTQEAVIHEENFGMDIGRFFRPPFLSAAAVKYTPNCLR